MPLYFVNPRGRKRRTVRRGAPKRGKAKGRRRNPPVSLYDLYEGAEAGEFRLGPGMVPPMPARVGGPPPSPLRDAPRRPAARPRRPPPPAPRRTPVAKKTYTRGQWARLSPSGKAAAVAKYGKSQLVLSHVASRTPKTPRTRPLSPKVAFLKDPPMGDERKGKRKGRRKTKRKATTRARPRKRTTRRRRSRSRYKAVGRRGARVKVPRGRKTRAVRITAKRAGGRRRTIKRTRATAKTRRGRKGRTTTYRVYQRRLNPKRRRRRRGKGRRGNPMYMRNPIAGFGGITDTTVNALKSGGMVVLGFGAARITSKYVGDAIRDRLPAAAQPYSDAIISAGALLAGATATTYIGPLRRNLQIRTALLIGLGFNAAWSLLDAVFGDRLADIGLPAVPGVSGMGEFVGIGEYESEMGDYVGLEDYDDDAGVPYLDDELNGLGEFVEMGAEAELGTEEELGQYAELGGGAFLGTPGSIGQGIGMPRGQMTRAVPRRRFQRPVPNRSFTKPVPAVRSRSFDRMSALYTGVFGRC